MTGGRGDDVTSRCDVIVHVTDVNDNSPRWSEPIPSVVSLVGLQADSREVGTRTPVIRLSASDSDAGDNASVTYSLRTVTGQLARLLCNAA